MANFKQETVTKILVDRLATLLPCPISSKKKGFVNGMNIKDKPISLIKGSRTYSVHSHTLYADDIMIFCKGDLKSIKVISNLKNMYVHCSSQICNAFKSLIFVGAMHPTRHKMLSDYLGFVISYPPFI